MDELILLYDKKSPVSIEKYAKKLIDMTFREVIGSHVDPKVGNKGGLGHLLEKYHFMYEINSDKDPDFKEAGVELKSTPYKINVKKKNTVAKERLVLNMINYIEVHEEEFRTSSFMYKNGLLLLVFYLYEPDVDRLDYIIKYVQLFQFPEKDLKIIQDDWNRIVSKIKSGKAHEISEGDTNYLGACTKGKDSNSVREQPFSDEMAPQRAFCLKASYMTHILNEYIMKNKVTCNPITLVDGNDDMEELTVVAEGESSYDTVALYDDSIVKNISEIKDITFEELVLKKINKYKGRSIYELAELFTVVSRPGSKAFTWDVAKGLLDVKGKYIEEFEKANIKVKTIRIEPTGNIKEHMSFPTFKYTEIIHEEWETSTLRELFLNTRYLFVIYKFDNQGILRLEKGMFWNVPYEQLEGDIRKVWEETVSRIRLGECEKLPKSTDNPVLHVRPHANDGNDTYVTPDGNHVVKKCFWLHKNYISEQINRDIN
ncbi:Sau3AI family type II restriction endonuclease [Clostridium tagluense]|uniref:Sau3AI family type II restriction endonuclease n=1 Tax=Clostridium tagluense TaxID=360422 RepID=UPI001C6F5C06|nr:Sau3AI family type II restriction endonuclease [Clostridium tagluense]MBW9158675.1 restriction endonuclease [Clostridium tagluense]WLC68552.1 restriction endonuclease [Clostridium tagluense]